MLRASVLSLLAHAAVLAGALLLGSGPPGAPAASAPDVLSVRFSVETEASAPSFPAPAPAAVPLEAAEPPLETPGRPLLVAAVEEPAPLPGRPVQDGPRGRPKAVLERLPEPPAEESTTEPQRRSDNLPPPYPESARRQGAEGRVVLRVRVSVAGAPLDVRVDSGSGSAVLDAAARQAVLGWSFDPAQRAGRPVESETRVTIRFRLTGGR